MPKSCDLCERALVPRGEIYYEIAIRVRAAGEVRTDLTPPEGLPGAPEPGGNGCAGADPIGDQLEDAALEAFLAAQLRTQKFVLCGTCRREFAEDPLGKLRRVS